MATARSFGQHFLECENCEENPAQFLCKTCPGHLCEKCKTEHEARKITKTHDIMHMHINREDRMGLIYCAKHTVNKLEWYCSPCKEPVCSKCLIESHNGHKLEELEKMYKEIRMKFKKEKKEIENTLLPKFRGLLNNEKTKKLEISKRTEEVQKQIKDHTKSIIQKVIVMENETLQCLLLEKERVIGAVEKTELEIEHRISTLETINEGITANLDADPGISFFRNTDSFLSKGMQVLPSSVNYKLNNFQPVDTSELTTEGLFGKSPIFSRELSYVNMQWEGCDKKKKKKKN
ncbi:E3 ubiquitin-protein ligase TRIM9-like [Saccostrea cucullata]|uniref:E3 ubiquitin-protein ligase TRIM9-like n=1 Tax=Saccostrea cuccullata TaxID=36930 RepID=UPI002ED42D13